MRWLARGHWQVAWVALLAVGLLTTLGTVLMLHHQVERNLQLLARTAAYAVEPAVVFGDDDATREQLTVMLRTEGLAQMRVFHADQRLFAEVTAEPVAWPMRQVTSAMGGWLALQARSSIVQGDRVIGVVEATSDGREWVQWIVWYLLGALSVMALTGFVVWQVTSRARHALAEDLLNLARFTREAREHPVAKRESEPWRIQEVAELAQDFDDLLAHVRENEQELLRHQALLRRDNQALQHQVELDALTQLHNRNAFRKRLGQDVEMALARSQQLAVLFIDVDRFKSVNTEHGHAVGDLVLSELARRLQQAVRETDVVGRIGGDEFAVLMSPISDPDRLQPLVDKVHHIVNAPMRLPDGRLGHFTISVGAAVCPRDGHTMDALLAHANRNMFKVKAQKAPPGPPDRASASHTASDPSIPLNQQE